MADQYSWGDFTLSIRAERLSLVDPNGAEWDAELSPLRPLFVNWFVVAAWFREAADAGRKHSRQVRKSRFVGHVLDRQIRQWIRGTRALADRLGAQNHWHLEAKLDDLAAEIEYDRGRGTFSFTGFGDYGVSRCLADSSEDPARLCVLYADSLLWGFNEVRKHCDKLKGRRSSLEAALELLLRQVDSAQLGAPFPDDVSAVIKRIQRLNRIVRKGYGPQLTEAVLAQVTREGPLDATGGYRTWSMWDRARAAPLPDLALRTGQKRKP